MELQDVTAEEIAPFFDALGREKELVMMDAAAALKSRFIAGVRIDGELAGLTGIRADYGLIPALFIVVKETCHHRGLGNTLMKKTVDYAAAHYSFLTLSTHRTDDYLAAFHLYRSFGFAEIARKGEQVWMSMAFNRRGKLLSKVFSWLLPVLPFLYTVFTGRIFRAAWRKLFRR